jgi:predicted ATPase/class 3 adenylate cyclase
MAGLPTGTVTFVFTDIEGSTRLLHTLGNRYRDALEQHRTILRDAFTSHEGVEVDTQGDAFFIAFPTPQGALRAAVTAQRALASYTWPQGAELRVRMGIHTGTPEVTEQHYVGEDVHVGARICAAAWGGQILVSSATANLTSSGLGDVTLRPLGAHALKDIDERVELSQVVTPGLREDFPSPRTTGPHPTNLPGRLPPLIGRDHDIATVTELLQEDDVSLVTLVGPGGTGKTRLALATGAELLSSFPDGVFFVDLSPLADPALVLGAIVAALGLRESPSRTLTETLSDHLASRHTLVILDNLEHLLDVAADVSALVASASSLKVLVTSREALRIEGERELPVPPLALPVSRDEPGDILASPAIKLFVARAQAVRPGFTLAPEAAPDVARICRRVDGLPLAIELAAARVKVLSLPTLAARLEESLAALGSGRRDASERQRTLNGAIAWSYGLLEDDEQRLFARLGVFAGGWCLEAAEAVCARGDLGMEVLDGLASLVDKSLVRQVERDEARFSMLETMRSYAAERLEESGEADEIRRAHAEFFRALIEEGHPELTDADPALWLAALEVDIDNVRAAFDWCVSRDPEVALRVAAAMWDFWDLRGHISEGRRSLREILHKTTKGTPARMRATQAAAVLADMQEDYEESTAYAQEALALARTFGNDAEAARALITVARVPLQRGDGARASALLEEAMSLAEASKKDELVVRVLVHLATVRSQEGDHDVAIAISERAAQIAAGSGSRRGRMMALVGIGEDAVLACRFDDAHDALSEAMRVALEIGDTYYEAATRINLGILKLINGDLDDAQREFKCALTSAADLGSSHLVVSCLDGLAAAGSKQDVDRSARLLAISEGLRRRIGVPRSSTEQQIYEPYIAHLRAILSARSAQQLMDAAKSMTLHEAAAAASTAWKPVSKTCGPSHAGGLPRE